VRRAIASGRQVIGLWLTPGCVDVRLRGQRGNLFCPQAGGRQRDLPTVQVEDGRRRIARAQLVGELLGEDERAQRRGRPAGVGLAKGVKTALYSLASTSALVRNRTSRAAKYWATPPASS